MSKIVNKRVISIVICILISIFLLNRYLHFVGAIWFGFIGGAFVYIFAIEPIINRFYRRPIVEQGEVTIEEDDFEFLARFTTDVSNLSKKGSLNEAELSYPLEKVTEAIERIKLVPDMPVDVQIAVKACDAYVKVFKIKREQKS